MYLTIGQRLRYFLDEKNIQNDDFAMHIGVPKQNVSSWLNDKTNITTKYFSVILLKFPELDARWLITGQGSMYSGDDNQPTTQEPTSPYLTECKNPLCAERIFSLQEQVKLLREMNDLLKAELNRKVDPPEKKASGGVESEDYGKTG